MHRTRSSTASQRSSVSMTPPGSPPATNNLTHAHLAKAWKQARKWKAERDANEKQLSKCDTEYSALLSCIWESRSEMPFWKKHEHPNHQHPIFRHLLAAGYKP